MTDNRGLAGAVNETQEGAETARIRNWAERQVMPTINTAEIEARLIKYHQTHMDAAADLIAEAITALKAETARADNAEEELEDERSWWPKWGLEIKAILERYGVDYSYTDEINLPGDLEDWIAEWTSADKAKQADLQSQLTAAHEKLAAARDVIEAARCIRHWHDAMKDDSGMVVSAVHVRALWDALKLYDANTGDGNGR